MMKPGRGLKRHIGGETRSNKAYNLLRSRKCVGGDAAGPDFGTLTGQRELGNELRQIYSQADFKIGRNFRRQGTYRAHDLRSHHYLYLERIDQCARAIMQIKIVDTAD